MKQQTLSLKLATEEDIPQILNLVRAFRDESPYAHLSHDDEYLLENIYKIVLGDKKEFITILLSNEHQIVGILTGSLTNPLFSQASVAAELVWYVLPEHRTSESLRLVDAFEYWAVNVAHARMVTFSSLDNPHMKVLDRYYKMKGYRKAEQTYIKDL